MDRAPRRLSDLSVCRHLSVVAAQYAIPDLKLFDWQIAVLGQHRRAFGKTKARLRSNVLNARERTDKVQRGVEDTSVPLGDFFDLHDEIISVSSGTDRFERLVNEIGDLSRFRAGLDGSHDRSQLSHAFQHARASACRAGSSAERTEQCFATDSREEARRRVNG